MNIETDKNVFRNISTAIYFLLENENISLFHRIKSDELWFFHTGSSLTVHVLDENGHSENRIGLDFENVQAPNFLLR